MKTKINGLLLAAIVALGALTACSKTDEADVLDTVGNNESVVLIDGNKVCASAGVSSVADLQTLSGSDAKDLEGLAGIEGVRLDRIAVTNPGGSPLGAVAVTDRGKVEKSLGRLGYKKDGNGSDVFICPDSRMAYQLDDSYLWMARASASKLGRMVDSALANAKSAPLDQWKRKALASGKAITGVYVDGDNDDNILVFEVEFQGQKLMFEMLACDAAGKPCDVLSAYDAEPIDSSFAADIDDNATLAFALGKADYRALLKSLKKVGHLPVSARDIAAVAALTNGPAYGYITLSDKDFTDLESISCNFRMKTTNSAMASLALARTCRVRSGKGVSRDGSDHFVLRPFGDEPFAELFADGDWLVARTVDAGKGSFKAMRESDLQGCLGLLKFNVTKEMIRTASGVDAFGVKGIVRIETSNISGEVELTGTSESFIAAFIDAASRR